MIESLALMFAAGKTQTTPLKIVSLVPYEVQDGGEYRARDRPSFGRPWKGPFDFWAHINMSNGGARDVWLPAVRSWLRLWKHEHRDRFLIWLQNPQVFVSKNLRTAAFCYGLDARATNVRTGEEMLNRGTQVVAIYRAGWKSFRSFAPPGSAWRLEGRIDNRLQTPAHRLLPCSVSVSPDGNEVLAQWTFADSSELWRMNVLSGRERRIWSGKWSKGDRLPKFAFSWAKAGVYWTPRVGGPVEFVSDSGGISVAARRSPFRLDLKGHLAFFLVDWRRARQVTKYRWVGSGAAHLSVCRFSVLSRRIAYTEPIWTSKFWVFPGMPEFLVSSVKPGWYFVFGNFLKSYFVCPGRGLIADTFGQTRDVHFATGAHLVSGNYYPDSFPALLLPRIVPGLALRSGRSLRGDGASYLEMKSYAWYGRYALTQIGPGAIEPMLEIPAPFSSDEPTMLQVLDGQPLSCYLGDRGAPLGPHDGTSHRYFRAYPCASDDVSLFPILDESDLRREKVPAASSGKTFKRAGRPPPFQIWPRYNRGNPSSSGGALPGRTG